MRLLGSDVFENHCTSSTERPFLIKCCLVAKIESRYATTWLAYEKIHVANSILILSKFFLIICGQHAWHVCAWCKRPLWKAQKGHFRISHAVTIEMQHINYFIFDSQLELEIIRLPMQMWTALRYHSKIIITFEGNQRQYWYYPWLFSKYQFPVKNALGLPVIPVRYAHDLQNISN